MESLHSTYSKTSETVQNFSLFLHFCLNVRKEEWIQLFMAICGKIIILLIQNLEQQLDRKKCSFYKYIRYSIHPALVRNCSLFLVSK